jgi:enamine deaminase RidA (YjgF/YER057c/UK114 family)
MNKFHSITPAEREAKTMPENIRFSNPDTMQKPPGYSYVVEVTGPSRIVYFAGQLGIDKSGRMGANAREQMEMAFENVKAVLVSVALVLRTLSNSTTTLSISAPI